MFQCMKNSETPSVNAVGQSDAALRRLRTVQQICAAQVFFKVMLCLMNFQTHRSSSGMLFHFQMLQPSLAGNTQIKELTFTLLKGVSSDWLLHWSWCKSWSRGWDIFCHVLHCNTRVTTLQWTAKAQHHSPHPLAALWNNMWRWSVGGGSLKGLNVATQATVDHSSGSEL